MTTPPASVALAWSPDLLGYDFGVGHPMAPARLRLTMDLIRALGLLDAPGVRVLETGEAGDDLIATVHDRDFIAAVRAGGDGLPDPVRGLGTTDNPVFPRVHEASARIVGATVAGAEEVWSGRSRHAVSLAGGMHHAMSAAASGFCIYNDVAAAIGWLLAHGCERVLYVDIDAHHGDGVERAFWDDPRVVTVSVHQSGESLFPGTGFAQDVGGPNARGSAVNVPLPAHTPDVPWLRAIEAVVGPIAAEFAPQVVVSQHGCDTHRRDPLTTMDISMDGLRAAAALIGEVADTHAGGRWLATGGGGYDILSTVPRAWAHLVAVSAGLDLPASTPVPASWREEVAAISDQDVPATMGDGVEVGFRPWVDGFDPDDPVDRAIMATRRSVFPWHGLDPLTA
ncbi:acetoin utilization protein AcuC [Occultella glacieicola]|uniref:Acetoin utilization protein AcuC n=1 Tax=Occultella glacieicola TaxID=2518684 RepID=A0ABY2E160_9MICO|nr:acetoin utilization protein AcuC [Occultella glacieicola]TDE91691.1 acetoin utilization protein AcuC [Occultella glacieicola]